jgi:DNA modification methylase
MSASAARGYEASSDIVPAGDRWSTFGPYYAMFPLDFARRVIARYTDSGDTVIDPFSGRGTTVFCAAEAGRTGVGAEITALGWLYAKVKLGPAPEEQVVDRIGKIYATSLENPWDHAAADMPEFFHVCFCRNVLRFLLAARSELDWRGNGVDATAMAFILVHLHGKMSGSRPSALSNQMRQSKAMAPGYSVEWWRKNGYDEPPVIDPVAFLKARLRWRYARGVLPRHDSRVVLGDCRDVFPRHGFRPAKLLLTSPPYCGVTSYYYDQWLRFWMLGESEHPTKTGGGWKGKFKGELAYRELLRGAFGAASPMLADDAVIYVRTDARRLTLDITREVLSEVFPGKSMREHAAPFGKATQTHLFGDTSAKPGETDLVLTVQGH